MASAGQARVMAFRGHGRAEPGKASVVAEHQRQVFGPLGHQRQRQAGGIGRAYL